MRGLSFSYFSRSERGLRFSPRSGGAFLTKEWYDVEAPESFCQVEAPQSYCQVEASSMLSTREYDETLVARTHDQKNDEVNDEFSICAAAATYCYSTDDDQVRYDTTFDKEILSLPRPMRGLHLRYRSSRPMRGLHLSLSPNQEHVSLVRVQAYTPLAQLRLMIPPASTVPDGLVVTIETFEDCPVI